MATIAGTTNEIEVSGSGSETASVTVGLPNDVTVGNNLTVTNDFTVGGSFTVAGEQRIAAQYIFLQDGTTGTPSLNSGVTVDRGSEDSAVFQWNETSDYWEAGTKNSLNRLALQNDSANFTSLFVNNDLVVTTGFLNTTNAITYNSSTGQLGHADTSAVNGTVVDSNIGQTFIQSASFSFDSYGHVTGASLNSGTATDTNTTYSTSIPSSTTKLRLSGSDATTDDIEFVGSGATTVTRTNASKFTISSTNTDTNTTYSAAAKGGLS